MKTDNCYRNHKNCNSNFCELDQKNPKTEKQMSDLVMENIAVLDCLMYNEFNSNVVDRIEQAINAYDEDQRKIAALLEAAKNAWDCLRQFNTAHFTEDVKPEMEQLEKAIAQTEGK